MRLCHKVKLVDPTLSAIFEKSSSSKDAAQDCQRQGGGSALRSSNHQQLPVYESSDGDGDDDDDFVSEAIMRAAVAPSGGAGSHHSPSFSHSPIASGGDAGAAHSSQQEAVQTLLLELRELLLPFATSTVVLHGTDQVDGISQALIAAVTSQQSPADSAHISAAAAAEGAIAALSKLKDLVHLGDLSDMLDSLTGLRLIKALCAFLGDLSGSAPVNIVRRRDMFRSQFCSLAPGDAVGVSKCSGLHALLRHALASFEENHSEVLALFDCESESPSSSKASSATGSYEIRLIPMVNDSGCLKHFGCASSSFSHSASSDLRFVAGRDLPTCSYITFLILFQTHFFDT